MGYSYKIVRGQVTAQQDLLKVETLSSSNSRIYIGDRPFQHIEDSIFTYKLIINLTNNNQADSLAFDDVAASILNESRRKNKENRQTSSQQVEVLSVTRGRPTERGPNGSHNHGRSKSRSKNNVKCYNCGKKGHVKKDYWNNQKRREGIVLVSSNAQGCVVSTLNDGEILYSKATTISKGRKQLYNIWLIELGAT